MSGEGFAILAALAYGVAGVTIIKGKDSARGDNGLFLSVLITTVLTGALWLGWGPVQARSLLAPENAGFVAAFALAGIFSTVLGRGMMYRATVAVGPVVASLLRRLTPVFALPLAAVLLSEVPDPLTLTGAALVIGAVTSYTGLPSRATIMKENAGLMLGIGSALFYAVAYVLRGHGLNGLPDAAFGTFLGGLCGTLWLLGAAIAGRGRTGGLLTDRGRWHWITAFVLSAGQLFQFFALKSASVVAVATLGTLEVFFSAALGAVLIGNREALTARLLLAGVLAAVGVAMLVG